MPQEWLEMNIADFPVLVSTLTLGAKKSRKIIAASTYVPLENEGTFVDPATMPIKIHVEWFGNNA